MRQTLVWRALTPINAAAWSTVIALHRLFRTLGLACSFWFNVTFSMRGTDQSRTFMLTIDTIDKWGGAKVYHQRGHWPA